MKKRRRTTEQIIRILRYSEGLSVDEACGKHAISAPTYHRWKAKYGGIGIKEAERLRDLEKENSELKKLLEAEILRMAKMHSCFGYLKITRKLVGKGWSVTERLCGKL